MLLSKEYGIGIKGKIYIINNTMLFSELFNIKKSSKDDRFDPILEVDTELFVDPFLIFDSKHPFFVDGHRKIISFFNKCFENAATMEIRSGMAYSNLVKNLIFPEFKFTCLGYADGDVNGSGSGPVIAKMMASAIMGSIGDGMKNIKHFERLGILSERVGPDRISDMSCWLLHANFIAYTQDICKKHNIKTKQFGVERFKYNKVSNRWETSIEYLPENPINKKPIILVPKIFLRELPTICKDSFKDFIWDRFPDDIKLKFNIEIKAQINKKLIMALARDNKKWLDIYERKQELTKSLSYDLEQDVKGKYVWYKNTKIYVEENELKLDATDYDQFISCIHNINKAFKHFVEEVGGYELLWNTRMGTGYEKHKNESAAQRLFLGIAWAYCRANNIDVSKEANIGRGPVDFKFSKGYKDRALLEVKLASNSAFRDGIELQLAQYLKSEDIKVGYFVIICFEDKDFKKIKGLKKVISIIEEKYKKEFYYEIIDARHDNKPSASKLRRGGLSPSN